MIGLIHIPPHLVEALEELEHLKVTGQRVDHPTTGQVRHKDIADAIINVVYALIGETWDATFERLVGLHLHASQAPAAGVPTVMASSGGLSDTDVFAQFSRSGSGGRLGHGARRGAGYSAARGDHRGRGQNR